MEQQWVYWINKGKPKADLIHVWRNKTLRGQWIWEVIYWYYDSEWDGYGYKNAFFKEIEEVERFIKKHYNLSLTYFETNIKRSSKGDKNEKQCNYWWRRIQRLCSYIR